MKNERVRADYSAPLDAGDGKEYLLDPRFDFVRVFPWINHCVINVVIEDGVARMHTDAETGYRVARKSGIPLVELEWITESEHETYLKIQSAAERLEELFNLEAEDEE